jgi:hypothetical protein
MHAASSNFRSTGHAGHGEQSATKKISSHKTELFQEALEKNAETHPKSLPQSLPQSPPGTEPSTPDGDYLAPKNIKILQIQSCQGILTEDLACSAARYKL